MGWTLTHRARGQSDLDFFRREFEGENRETGESLLVLDATRRGHTVYLKISCVGRTGGQVSAVVVLTRWRRRTEEHGSELNFEYKDIPESAGPLDARAPLQFLAGLSEPENECSRRWRWAVTAYHQRRADLIRAAWAGSQIEFAGKPIEFRGGYRGSLFRVHLKQSARCGPWRNQILFQAPDGQLFSIPNAAQRDFTVLP